MEKSNRFSVLKAIIALFILSPIIAELLGGATPVSRTVWSITIPIIFAELLFPAIRHRPWLNKFGLAGFSLLFVLSGLFRSDT